MKLGRIVLLAAVAALSLVPAGWGQNAGGQPAFADNPKPAPSPQFAPGDQQAKTNLHDSEQKADGQFNSNGYAFDNPFAAEGATEPNFFLFLGMMALRRNEFHRGDVATLEPAFGFNPSQFDYQSASMNFNFGFRGAVDVFLGDSVLELSGFYLFNTSSSASGTGAGPQSVFLPFTNAPADFNAAAYQSADSVKIAYSLSMGNVELNYRVPLGSGLDVLLGLRFLDLSEKLSLQGDASSLGLGQTTYAFNVTDRIFGPQVGFDFEKLLMPRVGLNFNAKAAVGPNFAYLNHSFTQNNLQGPGSDNNVTMASSVFEVGAFVNFWFSSRLRLHAGYEVLWVVHVPDAQAQVNFNTALPNGSPNYNGSFLFQGPVFELQLAF